MMQPKLRPDQRAIVDAALDAVTNKTSFRRVLYGNMGSGKTRAAIEAAHTFVSTSSPDMPSNILVVAPTRVAKEAWAKELTARGLPFVILAGRPQAQLTHGLEQDVPFRFVVIAPGQLPHFRNLTLRMLRDVWRIGALIIDELSMYRAVGSERVRTLRKLPERLPFVLGLTGTPVSENSFGWYAMMLCIDAGVTLGTRKDNFASAYFVVRDWQKGDPTEMREGGAEALAAKLAPVIHSLEDRRAELLPVQFVTEPRRLPEDVQVMHDTMAKQFVLEYTDLEGNARVAEAANSAVLMSKLLQLASGVTYIEDGEAFDEFDDTRIQTAVKIAIDYIQRIKRPLLVAYTLRADALRFRELLGEWSLSQHPLITMPTEDKDCLDLFGPPGAPGKRPIILTHPRSLGHGVNLQGVCRDVLWIAPTWSRELTDQFNARVWRTGQDEQVTVTTIVMEGTADDMVVQRLEDKATYDDAFRSHLSAIRGPG